MTEIGRRKIIIEPIRPLILKRKNGSEIIVNALGYGMLKPAVDFVKYSQTLSGRKKMESVGFTCEEFDMLYDFLTKVKQHWEVNDAS